MRSTMREELDKAETERRLTERALERATETARRHAEDELIRLATAEAALADAQSDVERLSGQLADLTAGDGAMGRLQKQVDAHVEAIARLEETIVQLTARAEQAETERDEAIEQRDQAIAQAQADGDRLRAHAAALGDELAVVRAQVAELQAAEPEASPAPVAEPPPLARRRPRAERVLEAPAPYEPLPVRRASRSQELAPPATERDEPAPESESELVPAAANRRSAMAELTAIASSKDDFTFRRH
jgi:hypothetical protein